MTEDGRALRFDDDATLLAALRSDLISEQILSAPVRAQRDASTLWIDGTALDARSRQALLRAGAEIQDAPRKPPPQEYCCWAALIEPQPASERITTEGEFLLLLPPSLKPLSLVTELLRLDCPRQSFASLDDGRHLVRVSSPPYFTILRCLDHVDGLIAFRRLRQHQDSPWLEVGWRHPLAERTTPPPGQIVLITADGSWTFIEEPPWTELHEKLEYNIAPAKSSICAEGFQQRLSVSLSLAPAETQDAPRLWIIRRRALEQLDELVQTLPQRLLARLLFAPIESSPREEPVVVLRARPGLASREIPRLSLDAETYVCHPKLRSLFLPPLTRLEPTVRRDRLRQLFQLDQDQLVWLRRLEESRDFQPESLAEESLQALESWVDYIIARDVETILPWIESATLELSPSIVIADDEPRQSMGAEPTPAIEAKPEHPKTRVTEKATETRKSDVETGQREEQVAQPSTKSRISKKKTKKRQKQEGSVEGQVDEVTRHKEAAIIAHLEDNSESASHELWADLAREYSPQGKQTDAGHCWVRALWAAKQGDTADISHAWAEAERAQLGAAQTLASLIERAHPTGDETRAVAALAIEAVACGDEQVEHDGVSRFLGQHRGNLDLRTAWLATVATTKARRGDALSLARCRDELLDRVHHGLQLERELPTFLRRHHRLTRAQSSESLTAELEATRKRVEKRRRKRSSIEAPRELTSAYIKLIFAYGQAHLGFNDRAEELIAQALAVLDTENDEVHRFLAGAFAERARQTIAGLSLFKPLSPEKLKELDSLGPMARYKIDRLRQFSRLLEPRRQLDAFAEYHAHRVGAELPGHDELRTIREHPDAPERDGAIESLIRQTAQSESLEEKIRLIDEFAEALPALAESHVVPLVGTLLDFLRELPRGLQPPRLVRLLMLSGHFGASAMIEELTTELIATLGDLGSLEALELARSLDRARSTLLRFGLDDELATITQALETRAVGDAPESLELRVLLSGSWTRLGRVEQSRATRQEAFEALRSRYIDKNSPNAHLNARLALCRALARALAEETVDAALAGLRQLEDAALPTMTDSFNTNSHFCLALLVFVESLVLGFTAIDLDRGPRNRHWLDEEELDIRRRIHDEMQEALATM